MRDLPARVRACLFDLDRVLAQTARLHAAAWKEMFDGYLRERAARMDAPFFTVDPVAGYGEDVDGDKDADGKPEHPQGKRVAARDAGGVFGCVVGVDRAGQAGVLREPGAVVVVADLSELLVAS